MTCKCLKCKKGNIVNLPKDYQVLRCSECGEIYSPITNIKEMYPYIRGELAEIIDDLKGAEKDIEDLEKKGKVADDSS